MKFAVRYQPFLDNKMSIFDKFGAFKFYFMVFKILNGDTIQVKQYGSVFEEEI